VGDTVLGTRGEPDSLSSLPRIERVAETLRVDETVLRGAFINQGVPMNHGDRVPWWFVVDVLTAEIRAGRPVATDPSMRAWR
jgi:hypothetical protein